MSEKLKERIRETSGKSRKQFEGALKIMGGVNESILKELKATRIQ